MFRLADTVQTDWLLIFKTADNEFKAHPLALVYLWKARSRMIKEVDRHCVPWRGIRAEMKITCASAEAKLAGFIKGSLFHLARCSEGLEFGVRCCYYEESWNVK